MERKTVSGIMLTLLLASILSLTFNITQAISEQTAKNASTGPFPQKSKFYTLAGREIDWQIVEGRKTTQPIDIMLKWSVQDVVGNVALVNRSTGWVAMSPEGMVGTVDVDYEVALDRTILYGHLARMIFTTAGFQRLDDWPLDMDIGEHTWVWYPTDMYIGAEVPVGWTRDSEFTGDTLYNVVGEEVIRVVGEKQDCWVLHFPPTSALNGWVWTETHWVDKDTGIPIKLNGKGCAPDGSSGEEYELVLAHTNIDLGRESILPASPTYTLTVPSTPGFPEAGKFWSWYLLDEGWYLSGPANVTYYEEGLLTRLVMEVTDDEALVYKIFWGNYVCADAGVEELEAVDILYTIYRARISTREIIEAVSSTVYVVNMTSLSYQGPWDWTSQLADDVGEETWCWLPTNLYVGATVDITWSFDRPWKLYEATYTVVGECIIDALGEPQPSWIVYMPPTTSVDGTQNYLDTWYSDKDTGVPLSSFMKGWAVDGSSAWVENCWLIDTNVDLEPRTLLGVGWGWMRIAHKEYVYGRAELYKVGDTQIELVIIYQGRRYSRTWSIIWHRRYKYGEGYLCYSRKWGFLIVGLQKNPIWRFWYAVGKDTIAFGPPRHGRFTQET